MSNFNENLENDIKIEKHNNENIQIIEVLKQQLADAGQEHIFEYLPDLNENSNIVHQLTKECSNWKEMLDKYNSAKVTKPIDLDLVTPLESKNMVDWIDMPKLDKELVWDIGIESISKSEVAAVIMSGGQGTRLGYDGPKGMYNINLPSNKSIFQLHIEKIMGIRKLAQTKQQATDHILPSVPIYVMTSSLNHDIIQEYFNNNNYFNYPKQDIIFFAQRLEPCLTTNGKIIIESKDSLSMAPDGNGGLYQALEISGSLNNMKNRNIKHLHIYGIDNMLTKSIDPAFIGLCIQNESECGNKVVW